MKIEECFDGYIKDVSSKFPGYFGEGQRFFKEVLKDI